MAGMERREFMGAGLGLTASIAWVARHAAGTAQRKVKVAQIGTGHAHAAGKMATLRKLRDDYEVVGIAEPDERRRKALEGHDAYKGLRWMTEEELLNTEGLEAVAVETEVRDLVPTASRCVAAGMHVHLDKPAGESLSAFKKVLDEATRQDLCIQMGYMFRYNPAFQFCFKAAREGWLGDIFEAHTVMSKTVGAGTRKELAEYAGGSMFELGCHVIDALVAVMGAPDRVTAYVRKTRPDQDDLADNQLAVFEYPKATATVRSAQIEVCGGQRRQFVVCGDEGTVDIRPLEPPRVRLALAGPRGGFGKGYQDVEMPPMPGRYDAQLLDFARVIRGEKASDYPPAHDLAVQEAVLRASGLL